MGVPYLAGSKAEHYDWIKIDTELEKSRTYHYPDGQEFTVHNVEWLYVSSSRRGDSHRLRTVDNQCYYVRPGWIAIKWDGLFQF